MPCEAWGMVGGDRHLGRGHQRSSPSRNRSGLVDDGERGTCEQPAMLSLLQRRPLRPQRRRLPLPCRRPSSPRLARRRRFRLVLISLSSRLMKHSRCRQLLLEVPIRTNLLDVVIEPGEPPLYLILNAYESMVWRIQGATGRLKHVIITSGTGPAADRPAGVIGVSPRIVTALPRSCMPYQSQRSGPRAAPSFVEGHRPTTRSRGFRLYRQACSPPVRHR